ncbi:uncharacterized protein [Antedon mediterranea]|uniref:uncharacterized protein isoform X2 n=1 Tax=Antedon mediterranea TaxID=105859 RepID=UPI003AF63E4F
MAEVEVDKPEAGIQSTDEEASLVGKNGVEKTTGASVIARSTFVFGENMESRVQLKRPAEDQLDRQKAEEEDVKPDDTPGEFPKASPSVLSQRPLVTARKDNNMDFLPDNEDSNSNPFSMVQNKSFIKPSAFPSSRPFSCVIAPNTAPTNPFKLKPATLPPPSSQINGTKGETIESSHSAVSSLIKEGPPEKAVAESEKSSEKPEDVAESDAAAVVKEPSKTDPDDKENVETPISETEASPEDSKKNYFIKLSSGSSRDSGFGVFGKFNPSSVRILDQGYKSPQTENYFLQFAPSKSDDSSDENTKSPKSLSSSGSSFMFGQNLTDRVTSPSKQEGELKSASEYVFGSNLAERVKREESAESSEVKGTTLAESASAYEEARENQRLKLDKVPQVNGEEDEENVLQAQCKLYLFDSSTQSWLEKGRGLLRLNDKSQAYGSHFHSRLVMRTQGSLRVVLNTKVWSNMTVDKANPKSIRITAMDSENKIRVFLIVTEPHHADQIYTAIDHRVQALRYAEQKKFEQDMEAAKKNQQSDEEKADEKGESATIPETDAGISDEKESQASDESNPSPPAATE